MPTVYDLRLIAAVTAHVAGVFGVANELKIETSPTPKEAATIKPLNGREGKPALNPWRNKFLDLPILEESLEDILAKQAATDTA